MPETKLMDSSCIGNKRLKPFQKFCHAFVLITIAKNTTMKLLGKIKIVQSSENGIKETIGK